MMKTRAGRPYADSRLVTFLERRIRDMKGRKTQAEIAMEAGFNAVNMMAMIKSGAAKLPLDRVPALARALECDPAVLFKLTVEQQDSALAGVVNQIFGIAVSKNESAWLETIRDASDHSDPTLTSKALKAVRGIFGK